MFGESIPGERKASSHSFYTTPTNPYIIFQVAVIRPWGQLLCKAEKRRSRVYGPSQNIWR